MPEGGGILFGDLMKMAKMQILSKTPASLLSNDKTKRIGVIGGAGKMGSYFLRICANLGYHNLVFPDIDDSLSEKITNELNIQRINIETLVRESDVVIVSVGIEKTVDLINQVGPMVKTGALFSHFTSVQGPTMEAMKLFGQCAHGKKPQLFSAIPARASVEASKRVMLFVTQGDSPEQISRRILQSLLGRGMFKPANIG